MRIDDFRKVIRERIRISDECQDNWDFGIESCWEQEIDILSEDIPSTIEFLQNECTADEYSWISEVIEDLIEKTKSKDILDCYKGMMPKFSEECSRYNIRGVIEMAEEILDDAEEN